MAVVAANGGVGCARAREGEKVEEGNEGEGEREGVQGVEEECVATSRASRRRGGEAGRVVAWRARRLRGVPPLCLPGEEEAAGWHGPAQCWACQVGRPGKWPR